MSLDFSYIVIVVPLSLPQRMNIKCTIGLFLTQFQHLFLSPHTLPQNSVRYTPHSTYLHSFFTIRITLSKSISLESSLADVGFNARHCFHAGPIIRRKEYYHALSITERRKCLNRILIFAKKLRYVVHNLLA